jgi:hypothetical protein
LTLWLGSKVGQQQGQQQDRNNSKTRPTLPRGALLYLADIQLGHYFWYDEVLPNPL